MAREDAEYRAERSTLKRDSNMCSTGASARGGDIQDLQDNIRGFSSPKHILLILYIHVKPFLFRVIENQQVAT